MLKKVDSPFFELLVFYCIYLPYAAYGMQVYIEMWISIRLEILRNIWKSLLELQNPLIQGY